MKPVYPELMNTFLDHSAKAMFSPPDNVPIYCFDSEVVELLQRSDAAKSMQAVIDAGIFRMPYDEMVIEFTVTNQWTYSIFAQQGNGDNIHCQILSATVAKDFAQMSNSGLTITPEMLSDYDDDPVSRQDRMVKLQTLTTEYMTNEAVRTGQQIYKPTDAFIKESVTTIEFLAVILAMQLAILMLNTRGIENNVFTLTKNSTKLDANAALIHSRIIPLCVLARYGIEMVKPSRWVLAAE